MTDVVKPVFTHIKYAHLKEQEYKDTDTSLE